MEDNSADLGCYGNDIVHTPTLDKLAHNGVRFTNAYTTYSVCSPSRSSIFTGLYPHQNGQIGWATHHYALYEGVKVLPQYLSDTGYKTGIIGKVHVNPESRFNFDFEAIPESNFGKKRLSEYASHAKHFIQQSGSATPYFLMVNFPDAHLPFQNEVENLPTVSVDAAKIRTTLPFAGVNTRRMRDETEKYYNCINRLDESISMLFDSIGGLENTLVIYLSDHGAQFSRGKLTNYEGGLKIPFLMSWEGAATCKNIVRDELISVVDLLPTILDVAGLDIPAHLPGQSLLPFLNDPTGSINWRTYLGADGEGSSPVFYFPRRSIRNDRFKLILNIGVGRKEFPAYGAYANPEFGSGATEEEIHHSPNHVKKAYAIWKQPPTFELYDLDQDPWEFNNLSDHPHFQHVLDNMKTLLRRWREETNDPLLDRVKLEKLTAEMDSINHLYPDHSYRNIPNFKWNYLDYLKP
ncbi:sulfatase [Membranicola marinus]|uniref:Sulfatase n=1 Tax=Membranihabitans marinus TaxID=1227546 RepID=A0A953HII8_9BACT|nr:sulfatase [Membranihabitans marinus]MBY5956499.1 sulfatase [Membranihabitans marinus]